jgi:hypothetical protein
MRPLVTPGPICRGSGARQGADLASASSARGAVLGEMVAAAMSARRIVAWAALRM